MPPGKANRLWKLNLPYHLRNGFVFLCQLEQNAFLLFLNLNECPDRGHTIKRIH